MFDDESGNLAIGIVKIAEHPDPCHTGGHAGRFFPLLDKFDTKPTFLNIALFLDNPDMVRAGSDTVFAANAFVFIDQHDPVSSLMRSPRWADFDTRRIVAMLTLDRQKFAGIVWERPVFTLFEMVISLFLIEVILIMAGDSTGMTPHALRFVNDHSVPRHHSPDG